MMTPGELGQILSEITYKPGWVIHYEPCVKEVRPYVQLYVSSEGTIPETPHGTPAEPWRSGKVYLSPHMCRQEVVGAVFGLIRAAEEHEMREWFRYQGASIYNPHLDPDVLAKVARQKVSFNVRENAMAMTEY